MKLYTSKNEFGCNKNRLRVNANLTHAEAWSYGWWKYVDTDKAGNVYFIDTKYSVTTSKHQNETRSKLGDLGFSLAWKFDYLYKSHHFGRNSLSDLCNTEINGMRENIRTLIEQIKTKGTRKVKNAERRYAIKGLWYRIKDMRRIRDEYLDKAKVPVKASKFVQLSDIPSYGVDMEDAWDKEQIPQRRAGIETWKPYFTKPNGKVCETDLARFINRTMPPYSWGGGFHIRNAPECIDKIKRILKVKGNECVNFILSYDHVSDLEQMIPNEDTKEYIQLVSWVGKLESDPHNILLVEKLHEYLVNKLNRKTHVPSEPNRLPVHPVLEKVKATIPNEKATKLQLITTDRELRAEGRRQGHCIGSSHYLKKCQQGYQALNYYGYTFFLGSDLDVIETHGKHNCTTPAGIKAELERLIASVAGSLRKVAG